MPKWKEFGEQVNRLVYAIAGKENWTIEIANRYVADRAHYSEDSIRSMRQGTFRPQNTKSLEAMVDIGTKEVELSRDWAAVLLKKGGHPNPEAILERYFPQIAGLEALTQSVPVTSPLAFFAVRIVWASAGSIVFLLIWAFFVNPTYSAPHELAGWLELIWGALIGAGLSLGLALADRYQSKPGLSRAWRHYSGLFAGGLFGAFLWVLTRAIFFGPEPGAILQSGLLETFTFGAIYTAGFLVIILALAVRATGKRIRWQQAVAALGMIISGGLLALAGLLLAHSQPAFYNQNDVDLFVGLTLRIGLILILSLSFAPRVPPRFENPAWLTWLPWLS